MLTSVAKSSIECVSHVSSHFDDGLSTNNMNAFTHQGHNCSIGKIPSQFGFVNELETSGNPAAISVIMGCLKSGMVKVSPFRDLQQPAFLNKYPSYCSQN